MPAHLVELQQGHHHGATTISLVWNARCVCGWQSTRFGTPADASAAAHEHVTFEEMIHHAAS